MRKIKLLNANAPDFAEKFREAIGAKPGDTVQFLTPQFTRPTDEPGAGAAPLTLADWERLRCMSEAALREIGLRAWDKRADGKVLMVFPGEWYRHIPAGFRVVDILEFECPIPGDEPFIPGVTDDDIRFGCLAYGIVISPPPPVLRREGAATGTREDPR